VGNNALDKNWHQVIYDESMDISEEEGFQIKGYCEPFSGMLGVYQHIPELFKDQKPELNTKQATKTRECHNDVEGCTAGVETTI
jgi:hypothetical protein